MRKWIIWLLVGTSAFLGFWELSRQHWPPAHVFMMHVPEATVQNQLDALRACLLDYRTRHGRFPTNDEGLGALDNLIVRCRVDLPFDEGQGPDVGGAPRTSTGFWRSIEPGRAGSNEPPSSQELKRRLKAQVEDSDFRSLRSYEFALAPNGTLLAVGAGAVYSPFFLPYMYENRAGLSGQAFADLPDDPAGEFSRWADPTVRIWCASSAQVVRDREAFERSVLLRRGLGVGLLVLGSVLALVAWRRGWAGWAAGVLALGGLAGLIAGATRTTCYMMRFVFTRRPEAVVYQRSLLDGFHSRGVLSRAAYERAVQALEHPHAPSPPATAPAGRR